jgi:hypothetical protein
MASKMLIFLRDRGMGRLFRFAPAVTFYLATLLILTRTLPAQNALPIGNPALDPMVQRNIEDWAFGQRGLPDDWTHHHVVFTNPSSEQQALEGGNYDQWLQIVNDPRFTLQQLKRRASAKTLEGTGAFPPSPPSAEVLRVDKPPVRFGPVRSILLKRRTHPVKKDWNVPIGGVAASGTGTLTTNNASGNSTITVDGQTLTGSAPTAAIGSGIFTGAPALGQSVTIIDGANTLKITPTGTASSVVGTVSGAPTSTTAPTITLTNSAGVIANTLTLTTSATGATATGTVSSTGPTAGQTITIKNGANTLTLTAKNGTFGTGTVGVANTLGAANGDIGTVGSIEYVFEETTTAYAGEPYTGTQYYCPNTTTPCVWWGTTEANTAQALYAAITNNPAACPTAAQGLAGNWQHTCYSYITAPNPSVTAILPVPGTSTSVTLTNTTGFSLPFYWYSAQTAWALNPNTGSIPAYAAGTNACTSGSAGTFAISSNPAVVASNLAAAINACNTSYPAVGVTASSTGNVVTIGSTTLGSPASSLTLSNTASNFVWSTVTSGSSGSNGCTSATAGTFISGGTSAAEASNIAAAINACNSAYSAVGVTASYTSGSKFTVTGTAAGPYLAVGASNNAGLFSWGTVTAGTAGSNTCTGSTTGTFAASNRIATLASNLAAAINACSAAAGVTAVASGPIVNLTARIAGSSGNGITLGNTMSNFNWSGTDLNSGSDGTTSGTTFAYWSGAAAASTAQLAANIATAINENPTLQGVVSATSNGSKVTVTADTVGTVGDSYGTTVGGFGGFTWGSGTLTGGAGSAVVQPNLYPAMYSASFTTASCEDFVVYPAGTGAAGAATIVAFSNLYAGGCSGTVPSAYWAYNTGGMVTTSPVLSLDGTQVMFVQVSGTTASLVLLKWSANNGTLALPVTPTAVTLANYQSCTAPCMTTLAFSGSHNDSFSSPFYSYSDDTVYVGDDSGYLHQFTGVFEGTPAETTGNWPLHLSTTQKLSSPVYDPVTGHVIVGDFGGILHSVTASTGVVFGTTVSMGDVIADAPLLDSTAGKIYVFVTTANSSVSAGVSGDNAVYELSTGFTSVAGAAVKAVGTGGNGFYLYDGIFDNVYFSSANATGNLYVVGNTGATSGANLYRIPITNSTMGTPVTAVSGLTLNSAGASPWPSPVEEFCNNGASACTANATQTTAGTDYVFFSVNRGTPTGCTTSPGNGCVLSYNVSTPTAVTLSGSGLPVATPSNGNGCWATGGIVIDNSIPSGTFAGASQIYFIGLGTNAAGGPTGTTKTSASCGNGISTTISATQASQSNP